MTNLLFRSCSTALAGFTFLSMVVASPALANERHITCGSVNYGYNYCRIYTGGRVRLVHQLSKKSCNEGDSWGYDSQGVWVDRGCRADFIVDEANGWGWNSNSAYNSHQNSGSSSHSNDNDNDIGVALGVAAGAAILGAIFAGSSGSKDSHYEQRHQANIPNWAIGTFQGFNPQHNSEVELTITPSGQVDATANGRRLQGNYDGRTLNIMGSRFQVQRSKNGLTTIEEGNYNNQVHYFRTR